MKKQTNEPKKKVVSNSDMILIKIISKYEQHELEVGFKKNEKAWVDAVSLLKQYKNGCLVERKHTFLQTQYILSGAKPSMLLEFNDEQQLVSLKTYYDVCDAPISYLVSSTYVLIIPAEGILPLNEIQMLKIL